MEEGEGLVFLDAFLLKRRIWCGPWQKRQKGKGKSKSNLTPTPKHFMGCRLENDKCVSVSFRGKKADFRKGVCALVRWMTVNIYSTRSWWAGGILDGSMTCVCVRLMKQFEWKHYRQVYTPWFIDWSKMKCMFNLRWISVTFRLRVTCWPRLLMRTDFFWY